MHKLWRWLVSRMTTPTCTISGFGTGIRTGSGEECDFEFCAYHGRFKP